jgi:ribosomal protein S17
MGDMQMIKTVPHVELIELVSVYNGKLALAKTWTVNRALAFQERDFKAYQEAEQNLRNHTEAIRAIEADIISLVKEIMEDSKKYPHLLVKVLEANERLTARRFLHSDYRLIKLGVELAALMEMEQQASN